MGVPAGLLWRAACSQSPRQVVVRRLALLCGKCLVSSLQALPQLPWARHGSTLLLHPLPWSCLPPHCPPPNPAPPLTLPFSRLQALVGGFRDTPIDDLVIAVLKETLKRTGVKPVVGRDGAGGAMRVGGAARAERPWAGMPAPPCSHVPLGTPSFALLPDLPCGLTCAPCLLRFAAPPQEVGDVVFGSGLGPSSKRANEASLPAHWPAHDIGLLPPATNSLMAGCLRQWLGPLGAGLLGPHLPCMAYATLPCPVLRRCAPPPSLLASQ